MTMTITITLTSEDLQAAPEAVRCWLLGGESSPPPPQKNSKPVKARSTVNATEEATPQKEDSPEKPLPEEKPEPSGPSQEEVIKAALALVKDKGADELASILGKMGIKRVKECPNERLSELLTEIAVHA